MNNGAASSPYVSRGTYWKRGYNSVSGTKSHGQQHGSILNGNEYYWAPVRCVQDLPEMGSGQVQAKAARNVIREDSASVAGGGT